MWGSACRPRGSLWERRNWIARSHNNSQSNQWTVGPAPSQGAFWKSGAYPCSHSILLHGAESFLRNQPVLSYSRNSPHFTEPEVSLPHSQVPATCPYPEPARSSPYPPHPTSRRSILILFHHLQLGLPSGLSLRFPHQNPAYTSPLPHTRYRPRPSHSSRFYHPKKIGRGVQISKLLIV
jgi:hypothetical protein